MKPREREQSKEKEPEGGDDDQDGTRQRLLIPALPKAHVWFYFLASTPSSVQMDFAHFL